MSTRRLAALVERLAVLGQLHAPRGPVQQLRAQPGFQLLHGGGHAGLGQAQALGRAGEAGHLGDPDEGLHGIEAVHDGSGYCSYITNGPISLSRFIQSNPPNTVPPR
jgi:hypothetical protein